MQRVTQCPSHFQEKIYIVSSFYWTCFWITKDLEILCKVPDRLVSFAYHCSSKKNMLTKFFCGRHLKVHRSKAIKSYQSGFTWVLNIILKLFLWFTWVGGRKQMVGTLFKSGIFFVFQFRLEDLLRPSRMQSGQIRCSDNLVVNDVC